MNKAARHFLILLLLAVFCAADAVKVRPGNWAQPIVGSSLGNFYKVSDELYRSEQPSASDIPDLKAFGIKTILSLRHYYHDSCYPNIAKALREMDVPAVRKAVLDGVIPNPPPAGVAPTAPKPPY